MNWKELAGDPEMLFRMRPADAVLGDLLARSAELELREASLEVGRMLEILAAGPSIRRILEVGRGLGLSTICLARGGGAARLLSVDATDSHLAETTDFLRRAEVEDRVTLLTQDPLSAIDSEEAPFDLVHLSPPIPEGLRLIDRALPKLSVGGLLTVEGVRPSDRATRERARPLAGYLVMHPQLDAQVLPIGEGLGVARKKRPLATEMGGPY